MFSIEAPLFAQVHWDAGAEVGAIERETAGRAAGAPAPSPGLVGEAQAHVALLPMLRAGPYVSYDVDFGSAPRQVFEGGLRAKVSPPLLPAPWRTWAFVGLGIGRSYRTSHAVVGPPPGEIGGAEGGLVDTSIGIGIGARAHGPWTVFAQLETRIGLASWGAMYDTGPCACLRDPYPGRDSFAVSLSVGLSLDP